MFLFGVAFVIALFCVFIDCFAFVSLAVQEVKHSETQRSMRVKAPKLIPNRALRQTDVEVAAAASDRLALEYKERDARAHAKAALQRWYIQCHQNADVQIPHMQIRANLLEVAAIPYWQQRKGDKNGHVMLSSLILFRARRSRWWLSWTFQQNL